jgi:hypothetical protein
MVDAPKNLLGNVSSHFDALFSLVNYLNAFSGAWMVIFVALLFASKSRLSINQRQFCLFASLASLVIYSLDFGNLYAWWLD